MTDLFNRRELLAKVLGMAGVAAARFRPTLASRQPQQTPSSPVALLRCESYEPQLFRRVLDEALRLSGGLAPLVRNKTVTVKVNLTGMTWEPVDGLAACETYQTHPNSLGALCGALVDAGARRIVVVETLYWKESFEQILANSGWDVKAIQSAGSHRVAFEDIRNRGDWPAYSRFPVPWGGFIFPAFDLNQRFEKTDILISLAKMKQHACAGFTGAVKNFFGNTPCSIYGNDAPSEDALLHRTHIFHDGQKEVTDSAPSELAHAYTRSPYVRVPRITADIYGARPADLSIVDGVRTIRGGEGHWNRGVSVIEPKVLLVGRNGVCTDAVATAVMGFDPMAAHGKPPFPGDNHLALLAAVGHGTNDLNQIEIVGLPLLDAVTSFEHSS